MVLFCLLLFMQNLFLLHQQLVIVLVARIRLLRILEVHLAQLKWLRSRSLRNPYVAKFDDPMTDGCQGKKDFLA